MIAAQRTIAKAGALSGIGIHTGERCTVTFRPAAAGTGIRFFKKGEPVSSVVVDGGELFPVSKESPRRTSVGTDGHHIQTVEHCLAALSGLGIWNIEVDVDGPEMPGLDGSAAPFAKLFRQLGVSELGRPQEAFKVREPIFCGEKGRAIAVYPAETFSVAYTLDYDHAGLRDQTVEFCVTPEVFESEIASARTFCTEEEAAALKKQGVGRGASAENTVVIPANGAVKNSLRFQDECARHKVLDIIGDLSLLGFPVLGRVVGLRSGHTLNRQLVEAIKKQKGAMSAKQHRHVTKETPMEIEEIKTILPHRYPFLLLDRIVEMTDDRIVGIKNVSISEPFFQGHFPQKPVMPGVLIIEALAQTGGILMLSKPEYAGKLAYLVAVNEARFRKAVVPGDQLRLEVDLKKVKVRLGIVDCVAKVDGKEVCSAEIMFSLVD
jgi:UDP-3-O-[3-hydroxymyristoyl] N-acetylglucosamine deacetylase/3-hydroxyacyl-[acyl-carrier-protein] dehydratase